MSTEEMNATPGWKVEGQGRRGARIEGGDGVAGDSREKKLLASEESKDEADYQQRCKGLVNIENPNQVAPLGHTTRSGQAKEAFKERTRHREEKTEEH